MNTFFKNLFTRRAFNIIVGICALIWVIILTWGLIELALKGTVEEDGWRARLSSYSSSDDYDAEDYKTLSTDTVYGEMFHFKDALVVPLLEVDNTRKRLHIKTLIKIMFNRSKLETFWWMNRFLLKFAKQKKIWNVSLLNRRQVENVHKKRLIECLRDGKVSY